MTPPPPRTASRPAPPAVPPVVRDGIRYEQVRNGHDAGLASLTGNLAAYDMTDNVRLWTLPVYATTLVPGMETDVQEVYFRTMAFGDDGMLEIVTERGARYRVDVERRTVTKVE